MQPESLAHARRRARSLAGLALCLALVAVWSPPARATSFLRQFALNIDGEVFSDPAGFPAAVDISGFDLATGLGTFRIDLEEESGSHWVIAFFDHEIDAAVNTFFNEVGSVVGAEATGQSWEVDEPGFLLGDLQDNFVAGALDGAVGESVFGTTEFPDDVAMALGWEFGLGAGQAASVVFSVGDVEPSGFHLVHSDPDSGETLYLTSQLTIVPEPGTGLLVGAGLLGFAAARRSRASRPRSSRVGPSA